MALIAISLFLTWAIQSHHVSKSVAPEGFYFRSGAAISIAARYEKNPPAPRVLVSFAAVVRVVTQRFSPLTVRGGEALRDDTDNGCGGDYQGIRSKDLVIISTRVVFLRISRHFRKLSTMTWNEES